MTLNLPLRLLHRFMTAGHGRQICFLSWQNIMAPRGHFSWATAELSTYWWDVLSSVLVSRAQDQTPPSAAAAFSPLLVKCHHIAILPVTLNCSFPGIWGNQSKSEAPVLWPGPWLQVKTSCPCHNIAPPGGLSVGLCQSSEPPMTSNYLPRNVFLHWVLSAVS